ncbi:hypothetical protein [Phycobacter azelaicus]|uniref:hypothetical protein n=1 Tax=Phycobacter azelaicus TaxID=2668075 RepID=UPI0018663568|nr:hypothetical protein [Phycobacter azelaicus]
MLEERDSHLKLTTSHKKRTVAAPWFLTGLGDPYQLEILPGSKACYDPNNKILHVRDNERGISHTVTPSVRVRLDHEQDFHDIDFIDLEDATQNLAGVYINEGVLSFEDHNRFEFSNTLMFQSVCRLLASPVFNPWTELPRIRNENAFYQCDLATGELWLNPEMEDAPKNVDKVHSHIVYLSFETSEPIPCWNKDTRHDDILPPGRYDAEVIKSDHDTGDVITIKADGWTADRSNLYTFHIPFEPLYELIQSGAVPAGDFGYRVPFDPRGHADMALRATQPPPKGVFGKLFKR